jgi:hypothetical protein
VCIVAGDVCRPADAAAAGLAPCTLTERQRGRRAAVTVLSLELGEESRWTLARRSDGTFLVTRTSDDDLGVSGGLGFEASPIGVRLGAEAALRLSVASGSAWELPDAATVRRFLATMAGGPPDGDRWPPTWRFGDVGDELEAEAGLTAGEAGDRAAGWLDVAGIEASADAAIGRRTGRGTTTLYFRAELDGVQLSGGPHDRVLVDGPGPVLVEYTRDRAGPRELAFRVAEPGGRAGEVVETAARLDLRDPANRAVAARLLRLRAPRPPAVREDLRAVVRQAVRSGVVERSTYAVEDASTSTEAALRLGLELGLDLDRTRVDRRLVGATAWTGGAGPRERADCLAPAPG